MGSGGGEPAEIPGGMVPGVLAAYGWTDRVLALFNSLDDPSLAPARVVRVERSACVAVFADGAERRLRAAVLPAVGDWIAVDADVVAHVLPRWSSLNRTDPSRAAAVQVLAANVDLVLIVAPTDRLSIARVEREVAVAWDSGAEPLVVVTKCDVDPDDAPTLLRNRLVGVGIVATSAVTGDGIDEVRDSLRPARTAVLLGPSGAGKSTLANALLDAPVLPTGEVRAGDHRGRHTTTSRQLVAVPSGGVLIDTPGLRAVGLTADVDVDQAFPDIESLAAACRFADCAHQDEPDCAVVAASVDGTLDPARLEGFRKLQREVAALARRTDPLLRKADVGVWKSRMKTARRNDKRRTGGADDG